MMSRILFTPKIKFGGWKENGWNKSSTTSINAEAKFIFAILSTFV